MRERWVFSKKEYEKRGEGCKKNDEFIVYPYSCFGVFNDINKDLGIIVYRNGKISNRWDDGTAGVPEHLKEMVAEVETFIQDGEVYDIWCDVEVDEKGGLVEFLEGEINVSY